ncbi:uncharacterized protein LOC132725923 isoform X3 [Ruditapes philippinarum]|uniref:uncharacterized protein LOC132725923 isoform X3 n=1 Tax=Ruditapes philippinarum TaxID=129788 RepID=UPI00295B0358|nr:uncharacterized protein LOC132725923 isoform X3 [Ruditapes philippinarum]
MPGMEEEEHLGGEEDVCLHCKCRREDDSKLIKSSMRKIAFLTAICSVLCVLTITACGCSLYFYTRFQGFRQDLFAMVRADIDDADDILDDHFSLEHNAMPMYGDSLDDEYDDNSENTRYIRARKGGKKKGKARKDKKGQRKCSKKKMSTCDCCTKKLGEYIDTKIKEVETKLKVPEPKTTKTVQSTTTTPVVTTEIPEKKLPTYVSAAHYTTYVGTDYINEQFGQLDHDFEKNKPKMFIDKPDWQGILYRNRTFITTAAPLTLRFFREADWMGNSTTPKLFDFDQLTGKFTALQTGLYHLYAHVLFYDVKTRMAIGLLHESKKGLERENKGKESIVFRCMESVDFVNPQLKVGQNAKFKSCSVNGVLFLNQGDNIAMQSLYKNTCIDLTYDATYFGAIYISTPNS